MQWRSRSTARTARSPRRGPRRALRPRTRRRAPPPRGRPATRRSYLLLRLCRLAAGEAAEVVVGQAVAERPERLAVCAALDPAADEADHGLVQLLSRDALEDGARDRRRTVEAPTQVH